MQPIRKPLGEVKTLPITKEVKTLRITGDVARKALGENAKMQDLQRYVQEKVAGQFAQISASENLGTALGKVDAAKFHVSLSWG